MSLQDRHARSENKKYNPGEAHLTREEAFSNARRADTGITAEQLYGTPVDPGMPAVRGVPSPFPSYGDDPEPQTAHCTAITKAGQPCKAAPIRGKYVCVGHARAVVGN